MQNINSIGDKVRDGCKLKVLILHPQSSLLQCLGNVGFPEDLSQIFLSTLAAKLKELNKNLENDKLNNKLKGSIEVKLHKDLFSPIGYYSDAQDLILVWMYFSDDRNGNEYPAFQLGNKELIERMEKHFDNLWTRTNGNLLLRVAHDKQTINNIKTIFPDSRGNQS